VIVAERGEVTGGRVQILAFVRRWSVRPDASSGTRTEFRSGGPPRARGAIVRDGVAVASGRAG
jgi:hypothetical protein